MQLAPCILIQQTEPNGSGRKAASKVNINNDERKVALYADVILVYLTDPSKSLPELFKLLEEFVKHAGYKLDFYRYLQLHNYFLTTDQEDELLKEILRLYACKPAQGAI